ncbi:MAG: ImmA/IrrE family metallo-endopeptidase [Candidatus Moranbacteria bacterium]|nr:ImmA/IrrE family metallo-endopeptidase [Candidatus Moranbacteria bacterium]
MMKKQTKNQYTTEEIKDRAKQLIAKAEAKTDTPVDITSLAQQIGYRVYEVNFDDPQVAGMVVDSDKEKSIYVSENDPEGRKRFTIAHELGHVILHHQELAANQRIVDYRKPLTDYKDTDDLKREVEANMFAAEILMPEDLTKKLWEFKQDVDDLAGFFKVSQKAALVRLESLALI